MQTPVLAPSIIQGLKQIGQAIKGAFTGKLSGFRGANPNPVKPMAGFQGVNPNAIWNQMQRKQLSLETLEAMKNMPFAVNYIAKRTMYCSAGMQYVPTTGDEELDKLVTEYTDKVWATMGVNCSMQDAYTRVADVFQPQWGDAFLQWYDDGTQLRLLEITADRVGEMYGFSMASKVGSLNYTQGLYFDGPNVAGYRIYDRGYDGVYTNRHEVPAWDVIGFQDDIYGGVRGVSIFAAALEPTMGKNRIIQATIQTMQQQSKTAAIASNNSGMPADFSYSTEQLQNGVTEYQESYADGAVVRYQFNGDSWQVLKAEHPSEAFIKGCRYLDAQGSVAVRFPYAFLFSGEESGGAPFRGDYEVAGKEITRLRTRYHTPRLLKISYVTIMDGVRRGHLPNHPNIAKGVWRFNSLPSVDSFRDDKSDIMAIRACLTTPDDVIRQNGGSGFKEVLERKKQQAIMAAKAVQDANKELSDEGYQPTIDAADIAQVSDNPQQGAAAEAISQGKPASGGSPAPASPQAKLSAFMGEITPSSLDPDTQAEIDRICPGARIRKYGMVASELIPKADPHNLDAARKHLRYCTNGSCADEVHANEAKHVLIMNDRVVDGHHFLAKAEKGKVSKSIPVLDLIPPVASAA